MAVFTDINQLPQFKNTVLTVGTFDGVHQGHITILNQVVAKAAEVGGESVLVTFDPHPRKFLFPHQPLGLITPLESKIELVTETGIDHVVVVPFNTDFSRLTAKGYIEKFLVANFHPKVIILGYDHRFGHDRLGDIHMLRHYQPTYQYELVEIPAQLIDAAAVSSTRIRNAIKDGRIEEANTMLGRNYSIKGSVVKGRQLGRTIGFPTANLTPADESQKLPGNGVYVIACTYNDMIYMGMANIGYAPTVTEKKEIKIEANLFDFDFDIYGEHIEIAFLKKIRNEEKFQSLDHLKARLALDKEEALSYFA